MMYEAISSFVDMIIVRASMDLIWHGETGVNSWSIGQIGAPFAWIPLLLDMTYDGIKRIRRVGRAGQGPDSQAIELELMAV